MTAAQLKKLHTIIGKIEALENQVARSGNDNWKVKDAFRVAKDRLMEIAE